MHPLYFHNYLNVHIQVKLYIIKCWNDNERFYKIGRTFTTLENRFKSKRKMPYNYEVIKIIENTAENIFKLETEYKNKHKNFNYTPSLCFGGKCECYSIINV